MHHTVKAFCRNVKRSEMKPGADSEPVETNKYHTEDIWVVMTTTERER